MLALAATAEGADSEEKEKEKDLTEKRSRLAGARRYGSEGKEVGYEAVSLRAQTGAVTRMSSLQSTARMSERAESSR